MTKYSVRKPISEKLREELKEYPDLTAQLLGSRGIKTKEEAHNFLNPNYETGIYNPFLMEGMDRAVDRILKAIEDEEHIVIYSDYDCDGVPGGVILHDFFKKIGYEHFSNYIPHRHEEGYGLNISAIEGFVLKQTKVLITVDCGIADDKPIDRANELGIDVILTDHHLENDKKPKPYVILNPNQKADKTYPFKGLCGAGVAWKLVQGLIQKGDFGLVDGWEKWLLDMAGLSTIADMVPLQNENRVIAYYGLQVLRKSSRPGLQQLCQKTKVKQNHITEDDIGFMIAPRINAASRMAHPEEAFKLLSTTDVIEGGKLAEYLDKINNERKGIVAAMSKKVHERIKNLDEEKDLIVIGNPDWKPALVGLVANNLAEELKKPVFIWGRDSGDVIKGSCRSDGSLNLVEFMTSIPNVFIDAGGHKFSGGFSVREERIHDFEEVLVDAFLKYPKDEVDKSEEVDAKLHIDDVNWQTYGVIEKMAPFGVGNQKPLFLFENLLINEVKHFGKEKNHLQLGFINGSGKQVNCIAFFKTSDHFEKEIIEGKKVNLIGALEKSLFRGFPELRLRIVDIL
jgi:single-stranded-DNA-specific exonuclease